MEANNVKSYLRILPSVLFLGNMDTFVYLRGFSDTDGSGAVLIIASFSIIYYLDIMKKFDVKLFLFTSLVLGFSSGIKIYFSIPAGLIFIYQAIVVKKLKGYRFIFSFFPILFIFSFFSGSFWYLRNIYLTGNPFYPAEFGFFNGPWKSATLEATKLISIWGSISNEDKWRVIKGFCGWRDLSYVFGGIGYLGLVLPFFCFRKLKVKALPLSFLLFSCFILLIYHPFMPFSGINETDHLAHNATRYLLYIYYVGFIIISVIFSVFLNKRWIKWGDLIITLVLSVPIVLSFGLNKKSYLVILFFFVGLVLQKKVNYKKINDFMIRFFKYSLPLVIVSVFVLSVLLSFMDQRNQKIKSKAYWTFNALKQIPGEGRVTLFNNFIFMSFKIFGDKLRLTPIRVRPDGLELGALHESEKLIEEDYYLIKDPPKKISINGNKLCENLKNSNIQYVLIEKTPLGNWPQQKYLFENTKGLISRIYSSEEGEIWKIL